MTRKKRWTRLSAALLTLVMALTLAPTALAATGCPLNNYGEHIVEVWETVAAANCHEDGVRRGVCILCGTTVYDPIARDLNNHDAIYTDEGNGYHSAVCTYHPNAIIPLEKHTPNGNGVCSKCGAVDYSGVVMNLPADLTVPVALNNANAKLSAGEIKLTLGSATGTNVTDDYTIYYNWYYNGAPVANTAEYTLPDTVTGKEGTYRYTLFVSAVPKSSLRDNVSGSCNVTVTVEDLISASATISIDETSFYLGDPDSWSGESVSAQIYAAVQAVCPRNTDPSYVVFHTLPNSTVGSLNAGSPSTLYYFEGNSSRHVLDDVRFTVAANASAGDYTAGFTVYDTARNSYPGVLVITVQQYAGDMDVVAAASKNGFATLSTADFQDFWARTYPNGVLDSIRFEETPRTTEGSLYVDYISSSAPGVRVTTKDNFYAAPGNNQYGIDEVTFLPGVKQTEYITLDFRADGRKNNGAAGSLYGTLYLFIQSGASADVALTAASTGTALNAESFQKAYQAATGGTGTSFYIRLLEVPEKGALYVNRSSSRPGTLLTQRTVANYPLSYSDSRGGSISSVTYVPAAGTVSESIRYVACSNQGKPLYTGRITFSSTGASTTTPGTSNTLILNMTSTAAGVKLSASSFENLPGALAPKLTMVSFTPPSAAYGTLYYGRTSTSPGTAITSGNTYFSAVTVNPPAGSFSLDNLTFIPAAGVTGVIPIAFAASDASNNRYTGTLRITVTSTGTTTPGTPTTPGTAPDANKPLKTFSDVPSTRWSYPYITSLATSGVLNGYEDGTFKPDNPVTLGEALKMIMVAADPVKYSNLAATRTHWASGYLDQALKDGLLASGTDAELARNVNRYTIAEIATKAMKLSPIENATVSPFSDMALTHASAKYVLPLYQLKIFTGSTDSKTGQTVFYGVNAIKREEFAAVVWRMQSYIQTGSVGTAAVG